MILLPAGVLNPRTFSRVRRTKRQFEKVGFEMLAFAFGYR